MLILHNKRRYVSAIVGMTSGAMIALVSFGSGVAFAHFTSFGQQVAGYYPSQEPTNVDLSSVWKAWKILNDNFVPAAVSSSTPIATSTTDLNKQKVWGMISGLAASLNDPYTFFLPPIENKQFTTTMSGNFEGVGMQVDIKNQVLTVISPLKGTPAEQAGIRAGDSVLKIDGVSTAGMDVGAAVSRIRGPKDTQVSLLIMRAGWIEPHEIKVTRGVINVPVVTTSARTDGIFVITLAEFTANSPDLFRSALREFVQSGDNKLILDLRGNPGGYLDAAVDIGSWFLPTGTVIVTEDYAGHATNVVHRSYGYNIFNRDLKMVMLVDRGSASASEILANALHYYGIGRIVGTKTFGKGVVQQLFDITPDTSLKVTVARWLGPDGIQIPHDGITPDVVATTSEEMVKSGKDVPMDKAAQMIDQL